MVTKKTHLFQKKCFLATAFPAYSIASIYHITNVQNKTPKLYGAFYE